MYPQWLSFTYSLKLYLIELNKEQKIKKDEGIDVVGSIKDIFNKVKDEITSPIPEGNYS